MSDTNGRGGVGIRLYVNGEDAVKRSFNEVGDSGRKMWAQVALGQQTTNPAFRALSVGITGVRSEIDTFAGRTGIAGAALGSFGAAGLAASVALAGAAVAIAKAREAMAFADEIDDTANKLAIGTDALQQYRYAMIAVGGSAEDADSAIGSFTAKLGEAQAGGRALQWFERLGFTQEQLQSYDTAEEALGDVMGRLGDLNKETERTAVSSKIGLGAMNALAREGKTGMEELMQGAIDAGYVMDKDLIAKGAEANQQFEIMAQVIDIQLKSAFIGLSDEVVNFTAQLAGALQKLGDFIGQFNQADARMKAMYGFGLGDMASAGFDPIAIGRLSVQAGRAAFDGRAARVANAWDDPGDLDDPALARQTYAAEAYAARERGDDELVDRPDRPTRPGGRGSAVDPEAAEAQQRQRSIDRERDTLAREELSAQRDLARLRNSDDTPEARAQLAQMLLALEVEERNTKRLRQIELLKGLGAIDEETQINLDQIGLMNEESDRLRQRAIVETQRKENAEIALKDDEDADRHAIDLLDIQGEMVGTARERYEIGRRILLAEQALERKLLEAEVDADGTRTSREQARLDRMSVRQDAETGLFDAQEVERQRQDFYSYGREVVQAIEDGRIGELIGDRIKEKLLDGALNALFNSVGGGGEKSGGGGFLSSLLGFGLSMFGGGNPAAGMSKLPAKMGGKFAGGGFVSGPGGPREDRVPAMLSNGEYVVNARATSLMRPLLDHINNGYVPGYANGGLVGNPATPEAGPAELRFSI